MLDVVNLIWICPCCIVIGMALAVLVINEGGYHDD